MAHAKTSRIAEARELFEKHPAQWEAICSRCGNCCYERVVHDDGSVTVDHAAPCGFLDTRTRLCTVYGNRFKLCERCRKMTPRRAVFSDHLPATCAYAKRFRKH